METMPLSQLATFIRRVFALNLPEPVWVAAELAQVSESRGHTWLTLVEKGAGDETIEALLDAVIWAGTLKRLQKNYGLRITRGLLQEGMSVRLRVTASFHERFGLKLIVEDIDPEHTLGQLEQQRQATLEALSRDGLLDRNANEPLPDAPQRLAVISADTAAGWADFRRQLAENAYGYAFTTDLYAAAMQGAQTTEEITTRLRQIARRRADYDLIVIVRGGGGKMDLAAFDDERLCRAVAEAPLPVVAGIGHEVDSTVLDRVVHRSLKTPTAVAAFLVDRLLGTESRLLQTGRRIAATATAIVHERTSLQQQRNHILYQTATAQLDAAHLRTAALQKELHYLADHQLERGNDQLQQQSRLLQALRPETTLARGYALVTQEGRILLKPGDAVAGPVEVRLRDGRLNLRRD